MGGKRPNRSDVLKKRMNEHEREKKRKLLMALIVIVIVNAIVVNYGCTEWQYPMAYINHR